MKVTAGIDGGGTKTTAELRALNGDILCRKTFGAFNLNSIGAERFTALLDEIAAWLREQGECVSLCIGGAGISNPEMGRLVSDAMERADLSCWRLVGDQEIALYGALEGKPGCALIAGTGSICFGRNTAGETARAGGWGHLIDDRGSGYALGRDALENLVRSWDGRQAPSVLTRLLEEAGLNSREVLIDRVYTGDKSRVAAFAILVEQAAQKGDGAALAILRRNAAALGQLVKAVTQRLHMERGETALLGGLLVNDTILRRETVAWLERELPQVTPVSPKQDAAAGAAMMAADLLKDR